MFGGGTTRRSPASQSARIRRHAPHYGGRLVCRAVAPFRVVKMRRRSFTPRFASKTIRSLAHFHAAGDEGNALVMIRRQSRRLQVAAIRGPRRKYFRWGKDVRPRKPNETLSRYGRRARRVAFLSPSGSPPKVFSVGQSERCSVNTVRRSIISMRNSNSIKKDEKYIPHFRRIALFTSGGGIPEGMEGEQHSHVRDMHSISRLSMPHPPSGCCMSARITPKQTGTDLNPTENTFGGDPGLTPSPLASMRSCFGCINVHFSECFVIKTRSRGLLRACFDFNETSLSRARKFLLPAAVKIFDAIP